MDTALSRRVILLEDSADDEYLTLRALGTLTPEVGVEVFRTGESLLDHFQAHGEAPHLMILDFNVPASTGLEVLRHLHAASQAQDVPKVMFSSLMSESNLLACYSASACSCVTKPMHPESYMESVKRIAEYWLSFNVPQQTSPAELFAWRS